ncbi:MAG: YciC family protein [Gammaproteobacteria bacterium]|tara:strand:- start:1261 stop:1956 length:696 start_codon:yes stop_codon:yes gene_type:complete
MTLQAISKGFEYYKKFGLNFTIKILPLIFLFGFLASIGSSSSLSEGISSFDISLLLINNFLISPLLTIIAIFIANDMIENNNRDVLVYYAISWQFLLKVLILSLISTFCIGIGLLLFVVPGILIAGLLIFVNYFAILENKTVLDSLNLSWEKSKLNFLQCILMAGFFWFITILTISILSAISGGYEELNQISQTYTIISSSLAIYIQVCLISFPILIFFKNQSLDEIKDSI